MPSFKTMNQEQIQAILDARNEKGELLYTDILTSLAEKEKRELQGRGCPKCGASPCQAVLDTRRPFSPGSPLPNKLLRCSACSTEFDPYTGLIHSAKLIDG